MGDPITHYSRQLAGRYGNPDPWIPHNVPPAEVHRFADHLLREVAALRRNSAPAVERPESVGRAALRIINLPELQPERRELLEKECLIPLQHSGVDAAFHDGCVGRDLPLDLVKLRHGGVQSVTWGGHEYTVDTSLWKETWSLEELAEVERRQAEMDWFPLAWLSFPKDVVEPQTSGFVGGHISHVEVWRWAHEAGLDWVMVLEDDATPSKRYDLTWLDIWQVVEGQVAALSEQGVGWDILYVGRTPSYTREGPEVTPLLLPTGYCLRTHSYCLSRDGLCKLMGSGVSRIVTHRPQDEVLASLTLLSHGLWHPRADFDALLRSLAPSGPWRALAFKGDGLASPLEDFEESARARSDTAPAGSARASQGSRATSAASCAPVASRNPGFAPVSQPGGRPPECRSDALVYEVVD